MRTFLPRVASSSADDFSFLASESLTTPTSERIRTAPMLHQPPSVCRANQKTPRRHGHNENSILKNDSHSYLSSSHVLSHTKTSTARMSPSSHHPQSPQPQATRPLTPSMPSKLPRPTETPIAKRQALIKTTTTPMASGRSTPVVKEGEPGFYRPRIVDIPARNKTGIPTPSNRPAPRTPSLSKSSPRDKELPLRPRTVLAEDASPIKKIDSHDGTTGTASCFPPGVFSLTDLAEVKCEMGIDSPEKSDEQPLIPRPSTLEGADPDKTSPRKKLDSLPETVEPSLAPTSPDVGHWLSLIQVTDKDRPESPKPYLDFNEHYTGSRWSKSSTTLSPTTPQPASSEDCVEKSSQPEPESVALVGLRPGTVEKSISKSPTMGNSNTKQRPRSISFNENTPCSAIPMPIVRLHNAAQKSTGVTRDSQTRAHTPSPRSFSQPRISTRRSSLPGTPTVAGLSVVSSSMASRIPVLDPKKTTASQVPVTPGSKMALGDHPITTAADLSILDRGSPRRPKSKATLRSQASSSLRSPSSTAYTLAQKMSLTNIKSKIRRVTPSPFEGERLSRYGAHRKSSMATSIGCRAGSSVRQISGHLGSGAGYAGSTLIIADDAHDIIMGFPRADRVAGRSIGPISSPTNFQHVSGTNQPPVVPLMEHADASNVDMGLGLALTKSHVSVPEPMAASDEPGLLPELMAASDEPGLLPEVNGEVEDREPQQNHAATLDLLERGGSPNVPTQDEMVAFADSYGTQPQRRAQTPSEQEHNVGSIGEMTPGTMRDAAATLQACADSVENKAPPSEELNVQPRRMSRRPSDCKPRYMVQTASQKRRASRPLPRDDKSISSPSRASSKASRNLGHIDKDNSLRLGVRKRTPSRTTGARSGSPGNTPLVQQAMNSNGAPRAPPSSPDAAVFLSMPGNGPSVPYEPMLPPHHAEEPSVTRDGVSLQERMSSGQPATETSTYGNGRVTPRQPVNRIKHRPRSESKSRFISNVKGFFSTKREVAPPISTIHTTRRNQSTRGTNLSSHHDPEHGRSSIRVTETGITATADETIPSDHDNATIRVTEPTLDADDVLPEVLFPDVSVMEIMARFSGSLASNNDNDPALQRLVGELVTLSRRELNFAKKEQILNLTQVFLDILINSKRVASSSLRAQRHANTANAYHELVQHGIVQVGRMLSIPTDSTPRNHISDVLRRIGVRTAH